jgi:hypothetical protein
MKRGRATGATDLLAQEQQLHAKVAFTIILLLTIGFTNRRPTASRSKYTPHPPRQGGGSSYT